jgi:hypothetical protein
MAPSETLFLELHEPQLCDATSAALRFYAAWLGSFMQAAARTGSQRTVARAVESSSSLSDRVESICQRDGSETPPARRIRLDLSELRLMHAALEVYCEELLVLRCIGEGGLTTDEHTALAIQDINATVLLLRQLAERIRPLLDLDNATASLSLRGMLHNRAEVHGLPAAVPSIQ